MTFSKRKFNIMIVPCMLTALSEGMLPIVTSFIAGNTIGEVAIISINILNPIYFAVLFISTIIGAGTSFSMGIAIGSFDKEKSNKLFGQGIVLAVFFGLLVFFSLIIGKNAYLNFMGVSSDIVDYYLQYYYSMRIAFLILPLAFLNIMIVAFEGDNVIILISNLFCIFCNTILAMFLCKNYGLLGLGYAFVLSQVINIVLCIIHIITKSSLRPILSLSIKNVLEVIKYSLTDAVSCLCLFLTSFILTKIVINNFGEKYVTILSLISGIFEMAMFLDGIGLAFSPLVCTYYGEKAMHPLRKFMKYVFSFTAVIGLICSILLIVFSKHLPEFFNIHDIEIINLCAVGIKIFAPTILFVSLNYAITSYYLLVDKVTISVILVILKDFISVVLVFLVLKRLIGVSALWYAYLFGSIIVFLISLLFAFVYHKKYPEYDFPLLLKDTDAKTFLYEIVANEKNIIAMRDELEQKMEELDVPLKVMMKVMLIIEEFGMTIFDKNKDKTIYSEWIYFIEKDRIKMVIKDDGKYFDISEKTDDTEDTTFRDSIIKMLLPSFGNIDYFKTISANRNAFEIKYDNI